MEKTIRKKESNYSFRAVVLNNKALILLIILAVVVSILTDGLFFNINNIKNVIRQVCASITLGCGFTMLMSSGNMDLSVGAQVSMMSVFTAKLSVGTGAPLAVIIVFALAAGAIVGLVNGSIVNGFKLPPFVVTIGTKSIYEGIACIVSDNRSITGISDAYRFVGQGYIGGIPLPIFIMVFMVILTWFLINKTRFGRYVLATGGNREAARACGIKTTKISIMAYMWAGACAAITALIMTGRSASGQPGAGTGMEMDIIAAVVIGGTSMGGGIAKIVGTLFGCLMIGTINNGLNLLNVDSNWQNIAKGLIIIFAIILDTYGAKVLAKKAKKL